MSDTSDNGDPLDGDDNPTVTPLASDPSIALVKTGVVVDDNTNGVIEAGDTITYTFTVTNTGNTTVANLVITDALLSATPMAVVPSTLAPGEVATLEVDYTITQADMNTGSVTNTAVGSGTTPGGDPVSDTSDNGDPLDGDDNPTVTPLVQIAQLTLIKTGAVVDTNGDGIAQAGEIITYTFTVTNTGNVTVNNIVFNDALTGTANLQLTPSTLAAGESTSFTINYTITQANINLGFVVNSASVTGQDPEGATVSDVSDDGNPVNGSDNPTVTPLNINPALALVKTAVVGGEGLAGDAITYTFTVTNTGNVTVNTIAINDALTNTVNLSVTPSTLAPGQVGTATATYTILQSDVDNCSVSNTATVTGAPISGGTVTDISDEGDTTNGNDNTTVTILCNFASRIAIVKTGVFNDLNEDGFAQVNETITYSFTVTNTGNTTLTNIVVMDDFLPGLQWNVPTPATIPMLAPGEIFTGFQATYFLTQADINAGFVENQASVRAETPEGGFVTDISDDDSNSFDEPTIVTFDGCTIKVYNLVSPIIAGYEVLNIQGINCYPDNTVEIYNRWGVLVYETKGYNNDTKAFRGISEGRVTVDKSAGLPEGTYFYVLKYVSGGNTMEKTGFLHLTR